MGDVDKYLREARSVWRVVEGGGVAHLERRVDSTVGEAAKLVISEAGRAGRYLVSAWEHVYGRQPQPSHAYREATRAVEAAAKPVISPKDDRATLGKMISSLGQGPQKWDLVFEPEEIDSVEGLRQMLSLLWKSQYDRHGTDAEEVPLQVSPEEAEAAVHLATTLVHWFSSGAVQPLAE